MNNVNQKFHRELFDGLENLLKISEAFYATAVSVEDRVYKMYDYFLATWQDYHLPFGLEARGTMFDITDPANPILVSAAPRKFFNYEQGEDLTHHMYPLGLQMEKMDGSLISTYIHKNEIYLKSKMSLMSEQSVMAQAFLNSKPELKAELKRLHEMQYTVNMEFISPRNQIVVPYENDNLVILNLRSMNDGEMMYARELTQFLKEQGGFDNVLAHMVPFKMVVASEAKNHQNYLDRVRAEIGLEGYVVEVLAPTPYLVKVKNLDYVNKHYIKDGIGNDRRLFEAIIDEKTDDLRAVFAQDKLSLQRIADMENKIMPIYNHNIQLVKEFYKENQCLPRKEYAMAAAKNPELKKLFLVSFAMNEYLGQETDYKHHAKKYRREIWGVGGQNTVDDSLVAQKPVKVKLG